MQMYRVVPLTKRANKFPFFLRHSTRAEIYLRITLEATKSDTRFLTSSTIEWGIRRCLSLKGIVLVKSILCFIPVQFPISVSQVEKESWCYATNQTILPAANQCTISANMNFLEHINFRL